MHSRATRKSVTHESSPPSIRAPAQETIGATKNLQINIKNEIYNFYFLLQSLQIIYNKFGRKNHSLKKLPRTSCGLKCNLGPCFYRNDFADSYGLVFQWFTNRIY